MQRTPAIVIGALVFLLGAAPIAANDAEEGARLAREAHAKGDAELLAQVAGSDHGDVWAIAERLLLAGDAKAAEALAEAAAEDPDAKALADYVAGWAERPTPAAHAAARGELTAGVTPDEPEEVLARLEALDLSQASVMSVELHGYLGSLRSIQKRPINAVLDAYETAAKQAQEIGWSRAAREALARAMKLALAARNYARSAAIAKKQIPLLQEERHQAARSAAYDNMARSYRYMGRLFQAIEPARRAYALAVGDVAKRNMLRHYSIVVIQVGNPHKAFRMALQLRKLEVKLDNPAGIAAADTQLASLGSQLGRWSFAVARIERALAYFNEHGRAFERRGVNLHAARIAVEMRDPERALEHVAMCRQAGKGLGLNDSPVFEAEAGALMFQERFPEAVRALEESVRLAAKMPVPTRAKLLFSLATALAAAGRGDEALERVASARALLGSGASTFAKARALATEAYIHLARGDPEAAVKAGSEARHLCDEMLLYQLASVIEGRLAQAWLSKGHPERALVHADEAMKLVLRRSAALPERLGAQYRSEVAGVFQIAAQAAINAKDPRSLYAAAERARAVSLRNRLGGTATYVDALDPETRKRELALQEEETQAVRRYRGAVHSGNADAVKKAFEDLGAVREKLDRHRERMQAEQATTAQVIDPQLEDLVTVGKRLRPDEVHVHLIHALRDVVALVVTDTYAAIEMLGTPEQLGALMDETVLEDPATPAEETVAKLRKKLVEPLRLKDTVRRITVIPTGRLSRLPFGALFPGRDVTLLPSAVVGRLLAERVGEAGADILAVGDPDTPDGTRLPGAAREAEAVGDTRLIGKEATEGRLRTHLDRKARWRVVHLACHGLVDPVHPLRTSLALAPEADNDGLWTVSEILGSRVASDLTVLAACSGAEGKTFMQEGRIGLVHAFFVAGTTRVLASLWDIDDAATEALMGHFYAAMAAGRQPAAALRAAQEKLRADPKFAHPAHWAGWQLWGPADK